MDKNQKNVWPVSLFLVLIVLISGCDYGQEIVENTNQNDLNILDNGNDREAGEIDYQYIDEKSGESIEDDGGADLVSEVKKLIVDGNKCIGCGKCARTASASFSMENGTAMVISQDGLDSVAVDGAIKGCPVRAIQII